MAFKFLGQRQLGKLPSRWVSTILMVAINENTIYTHGEAARIVELFEDVLDEHDIKIPSSEEDEHEPDNETKLYGSVYWNLIDGVEESIINLLQAHKYDTTVIKYKYSDRF